MAVGITTLVVVGCRAPTFPPETRPDSVRGVRGQLQGVWQLVELLRVDVNGTATPMAASGRLTYDAFGHVVSEGREENGPSPLLTYTGRATIDSAGRSLTVRDPDDDAVPPRVRRFEFPDPDTLVFVMLDGHGQPEARARWRRLAR